MIRQQISILKDLESTKTDDVIRSNSICRFCLRIFQLREKQIAINNFIRKEFNEITRTELKEAENYSKNICKDCFSSIQEFATFRALLIQNQKLIDDDSLRNVDVTLKIENESEDEEVVLKLEREESIEVYYEEHLEEHEESYGDAEDHLNDQLNISRQSNKMTKGGRNKLCSGKSKLIVKRLRCLTSSPRLRQNLFISRIQTTLREGAFKIEEISRKKVEFSKTQR